MTKAFSLSLSLSLYGPSEKKQMIETATATKVNGLEGHEHKSMKVSALNRSRTQEGTDQKSKREPSKCHQ